MGESVVCKKLSGLLLLLILLAGLTSCGPTTDERIAAQGSTIKTPQGVVLLFEKAFRGQSATGKCLSFSTDRWYGTDRAFEDVLPEHETQLEAAGWVYEEQGYVTAWYKEDDRGRFRVYISDVTESVKEVDFNRTYTISDEQLEEMVDYSTIYLINLHYVSFATIRKCYSD